MNDIQGPALVRQRAEAAISEGLTAEGFVHHARVQRNTAIGVGVIAGGITAWGHWIIASLFAAWSIKCLWQTTMARRMAAAIRFVQAGY